MQHFPVFLRLTDKRCLVVGGGVVAERKVRLLLRSGANVMVVASALNPELTRLRKRARITHHAGAFEPGLLDGIRLVVAATNDTGVNHEVARTADNAGIFCNVVDDCEASGFIVPAIVDRSPVVVAIGTGGSAPVLAQQLKTRIEAWLPTRIGALAEQAGKWRHLVKKRYATMRERRRFWQRFFSGSIAQHLLAGRQQEAEHELRVELIRNVVPHTQTAGEAYIVGAGPGDPGLVTLRAQQLISQADVVLHDRLVSKKVLDFARKDAELVSVGKMANRVTITQDEINQLLVSEVRKGRRVCRLKGGDPFIFGRGGEEVMALSAAGLPFQVVPGVSAALGCAAYAGIPLTYRGLSQSVTFATAKLGTSGSPDWNALARPGQTLVLYMAVGSIADTASKLVSNGLAATIPAAIVEHGTTEQQRVVRATLEELPEKANAHKISSPALLIIGETAGLGPGLEWFSHGDAGLSSAAFSDSGMELPMNLGIHGA